MAQRQQDRQGNRQRGGGGQAKVFVSLPSSGEAISKGIKSGTYNLTLLLGLTGPQPQFAIPVKIFVNDKQIALINIAQTGERNLREIKLDLSKPVEVRIEKAGFPNESDRLTLDPKDHKVKSATTPAHEDEGSRRLVVAVSRLRADRTHLVDFRTMDENGIPEGDVILIQAGQQIMVNGKLCPDGECDYPIPDEGTAIAVIQLLDADGQVIFWSAKSRERVVKSLLKEP